MKDQQKEVYEPGMAGMREMLAAVQRAENIKTFVLTSSMAAIAPKPEPAVKNEDHWSDFVDSGILQLLGIRKSRSWDTEFYVTKLVPEWRFTGKSS